jgi:hypothetical protein
MVFTVAELEQSILADLPVAAHRGAIQPHARGPQIVDAQQRAGQAALKVGPVDIVAQDAQDIRQPVIGQIQHLDGLAGADPEGIHLSFDPGLHLIHAMVGLRQDVRQPDRGGPAKAQPVSITMHWKMAVQQHGQSHSSHVRQQEWDIIHALSCNCQHLGHTESVLESENLVQI